MVKFKGGESDIPVVVSILSFARGKIMLLQMLYLDFWSSHGAVTKVLDCDLKVNEFELQFRYNIHLRNNTPENDIVM